MSEVIGNSVDLIIQAFIQKLTEDQWKSLTAASPTNVTNILVAEMALNIIDAVTESMMTHLSSLRRLESVEDAVPDLEELLQQSFCQALQLKPADESLKSLTKMIRQENQETLNALNATSEPTAVNQHITSPSRLNRMVCCINDLLRKVGDKVTAVLQPSDDGGKPAEDQEDKEDKWIGPDSVQETIRRELRDISTLLMEDVGADEFKELELVSSEEIERVEKEVALLASKEAEGKRSFKGLRNQLKVMFAKGFLQAWLCRLLAQLRKKHQEDFSRERCEAIVEQLTPQLLNDLHGQDEKTSSLKVKSKHITGAKVLALTQRLTPLFCHRSTSVPPGPDRTAPAGDKPLVPYEKGEVYKDVRRQSWICTVLMKWFLKTVVKGLGARLKHSILKHKRGASLAEPSLTDSEAEEVTQASEASEPPYAMAVSGEVEPVSTPVVLESQSPEEQPAGGAGSERQDEERQGTDSEADIKMSYVRTFIEKVVFHVCVDAHVLFGNKYKVSNGLFEKVWADVKNESMYVTPRTFKNLDKKIHQCLCARFQPLELLCLMTLQDPLVTRLCVSLVKQRLMMPPQEPSLCRFFSCVAKVLHKAFTQRPGST